MMIEGLHPYSDVRPTALPWLGDVPSHWQILRSKYVFREVDKRSETGEETQLSMSQVHGLIDSSKIDTWRLRSESYVGGKLCEAGDFVLNRLKAHLGVFAHASTPGIVSPDYTVFRPIHDDEVRYFEYLYKIPEMRAELRRRTKGIVEGFWRLYSDDFYNIRVVIPPVDEQRLILRFLDWHGGRAANLIRAKRRTIALLNEQKQAIIDGAVRGDPAKWVVKPLKHWLRQHAKMLSDKTDQNYQFEYIDISCVGTGFLTSQPERMLFKDAPSRARQIVEKGDTLISTVRTYLKAVYFVEEEWPDLVASTGFAVLRPMEQVHPKLLGYILQSNSFIDRVNQYSIGVTYPGISETRLRALPIAIPSGMDEQEKIVHQISDYTAALDAAISHAQRQIALVQEARQRVVSDVVTGKLDVRMAAASLPEQTDDPEPIQAEDAIDDFEDSASEDFEPDEAAA